jgi:hypothetical protein
MKLIEWPKRGSTTDHPKAPHPVLLPELDLIDADYEAAGEALRKLDDCFFEVVFVHEVAARHCRERQLAAQLLRNQTPHQSEHARAKDLVEELKKPTPLSQLDSFAKRDSKSHQPKTLP